jgi:8-oxo-dGTP pyrophosphatase MutT (NUDIX family)
VDPSDPDPEATAVREVEEETGWKPKSVQRISSFQPMVGTADAENILSLGTGAEYTGKPQDINEAERVAWIELATVRERIARGEIVGVASQIALLHLLAFHLH